MATKTEEIWIGEDDARRKLEGAELEAFLADREALHLEIAERKAQAEATATARQAVLDRLGITSEEAQLILGGSN
jgi:hypothetical protein